MYQIIKNLSYNKTDLITFETKSIKKQYMLVPKIIYKEKKKIKINQNKKKKIIYIQLSFLILFIMKFSGCLCFK